MYQVLSEVYDQMQEIDYTAFADYYEAVFQKFGCRPKLVLDLGCGTGNITLELARRGYDMIGLDNSAEMLDVGAQKAKEAGYDILFLQQDMAAFELYGTVGAMVCALDGVNYLTEDGALGAMLSLLHCYLDPGGILIFDINTPYKFRHVLDGRTFIYDCEDAYCAWSSEYDGDENLCYFDLNFFFPDADGRYTRKDEYQQERVYTVDEIKECIKKQGLSCLGVYDALSFDPPQAESERLFFVVQRPV